MTATGPGRLAGRRILVVGAGQQASDEPDPPMGNGRAISVRSATEGAAVACADRDEDSARQTAELARGAPGAPAGGGAVVVVGDVTRPEDCDRIVSSAAEALGGLDGVVCNVGIGAGGGLAGTSPEVWDRVFAVNVRSHFLVARAAMEHLDEGAALVFVSSLAGSKPGSRLPAYDASKAALPGLCRHVALEGSRRGVRANVVAPGLIDTPLGRLANRGRPSRVSTRIPLGRSGTAHDVAVAVVFLLSDESSYITGQVLAVDGGLSTL